MMGVAAMVRNFAVACLLVLAGLIVGAATPGAEPRTINLTMVDYRFTPDHLVFEHDVAYRLHLENHGKELHEFTAPEFLAASIVRQPDLLANGGKEIVVHAGEVLCIPANMLRHIRHE